MPVTESLQTMGSWSLTLRPDTPKFIRDKLSIPWQHVVIMPSWVQHIEGVHEPIPDADLMTNAIYTGVVLRPGPQYELGGVGNLWWLGDDRGVPHMFQSVGGPASQSLATWVSQLLNSAHIGHGTVTGSGPVGGNVIAYFPKFQSRRQALDAIFRYYQVEHRVNMNWTLDYGTAADLYGSTPIATALPRGQGGRELGLKGFRVTDLEYSRDFTDYVSRVTVGGRGSTGEAIGLDPADLDSYGPDGRTHVRQGFFDSPDAANTLEVNYAETLVARYSDVDFVGVSTDDMVRSTFGPGHLINVYDIDRGLLDDTNQDLYQGEVIFPKAVRVIGMTWPVQHGLGVYHRKAIAPFPSAEFEWTDLTPYVEWERPGTRIEIGNVAYSAISGQFSSSPQTAPVKAGEWDPYTPTWTSAGTPPAIGNGSLEGRFRRDGTTLHLRIRMRSGTTTTYGSANGWTFSLPSGMTAYTGTDHYQMLDGFTSVSGVGNFRGGGYVTTGATVVTAAVTNVAGTYGTISGVTNTIPGTWPASTAGSFVEINGTIEVAP